MEGRMSLDKAKQTYLEQRLKLRFSQGENSFEAPCQFCGKKLKGKLTISRFGSASNIHIDNGTFHHQDGNHKNNNPENLILLCYTCHKRFHDWGVIQRWLRKMGKTVSDLPDCSQLKPYFVAY